MNKPELIIIHHTAVSSLSPQFDSVERHHANHPLYGPFPKSSLGYHVGYHWFIERDGKRMRARADGDEGAHTIGWNKQSIGVCLAGNFDVESPTKQQLETLQDILNMYNLDFSFHRDKQDGRTCPGFYMTHELVNKTPEPELMVERQKRILLEQQVSTLWSIIAILQDTIKKLRGSA